MTNLDSILKSRDITFPTRVRLVKAMVKINKFKWKKKINKRRLLLGRKVMTNLDSILKSRDITLATKVRLVKAIVFPVAVYGRENWTVQKAECRRIDAFEL